MGMYLGLVDDGGTGVGEMTLGNVSVRYVLDSSLCSKISHPGIRSLSIGSEKVSLQ